MKGEWPTHQDYREMLDQEKLDAVPSLRRNTAVHSPAFTPYKPG